MTEIVEFEPIAYEVQEDDGTLYYCEECKPEEATPIISWSWGEVMNAAPHGEYCQGCDLMLMLGWCASQEGNEGNGFCDDCRFDAMDGMEDNHENLGD